MGTAATAETLQWSTAAGRGALQCDAPDRGMGRPWRTARALANQDQKSMPNGGMEPVRFGKGDLLLLDFSAQRTARTLQAVDRYAITPIFPSGYQR